MVKQGFGELVQGRAVQGTVSHVPSNISFDSDADMHYVLQAWSAR